MPQGSASTKFYIVCSDQPRNGKTLIARLLSDYLLLSGRAPLIFDAAPGQGGLRSYFPSRASKVDVSTTAGQMALFDRALAQPLHDCVVDLPAHLLASVVELMGSIGFGEEAHTPELDVMALFVADRSADSLLAGRKLRAQLRPVRFVLVKNEAVLTAAPDGLARYLYDGLAKQGHLVVPKLEGSVMAAVEDKVFSFRRFAEDIPTDMADVIRQPLAAFLHHVYEQFMLLDLAAESGPRAAAGAQAL